MRAPNLLVESSAEDVADLVAAVSCYAGEVQRNPFHLRLPPWMQDNVRRGGEVVGGQGGPAPAFDFATLYRLGRWQNGHLDPLTGRGPPAGGGGRSRGAAGPVSGVRAACPTTGAATGSRTAPRCSSRRRSPGSWGPAVAAGQCARAWRT